MGWPVLTLILVAALMLLAPVAEDLAIRVMSGLVALLALSTVCTYLPLPGPLPALAIIVVGLLGVQVVAAARRPQVGLVPRLRGADLVVTAGVLVYGVMLALPYLGGSPDDVLLDLARGYDNVNHVSMVNNLVRHGPSPWPTADGSLAMSEGYPLAIHQVIAALGGAAAVEPGELIVRFAVASVILAMLAPAVAGWIGVRVSASLPAQPHRVPPASATALAFGVVLVLGADYTATFVLGHTAFVLPALVGAGASALAMGCLGSHRDERRAALRALGVLAAGALGLLGSYPPLIAGLVPAGILVLSHLLSGYSRRFRLGVSVGLAVAALMALVVIFAGRIEHLIVSRGETGNHLLISVLALCLTGILWNLRAHRGPAPGVLRGMLPVLGYAGAAVALLAAAALSGGPVAESYYATKLMEAAWLVSVPVALALVESVARGLGEGRSRAVGAWRLGALALACALVLSLPVGRLDGPLPGVAQLERRLLEADRARGQSMIVLDADAAGPEGPVATVVPEPNGWFLRLDQDQGEQWDWTKPAETAALWVMALWGVRTQDADPVAVCMVQYGDASAIPCVQEWVDADEARRLTVILEPGVASAPRWRQWADSRSTQVRVVETPDQP